MSRIRKAIGSTRYAPEVESGVRVPPDGINQVNNKKLETLQQSIQVNKNLVQF